MPQPVPSQLKIAATGSVDLSASTRLHAADTFRRLDAAIGADRADAAPAERVAKNVSRHELQRRLWHMSPGLLPFVMIGIPHRDPLSFTTRAVAATLIIGIGTLILLRQRTLARHGEAGLGSAVLGYAGATLTLLLAFPAHAELGLTLVAIMAFGDGTATLSGWLAGGKPLPWNRAKSWTGTCCFVAAALPLAVAAYWGEAKPGVPFLVALACVAPAVIVGALAESIRSPINDNIRVGVASGLTIVATHAMFVGW